MYLSVYSILYNIINNDANPLFYLLLYDKKRKIILIFYYESKNIQTKILYLICFKNRLRFKIF